MSNENEKKTLIPELLPAPPSISSRSPRERVAAHLVRLKQFGVLASTAALANCGYMVVDPLPPPAQCRTADESFGITGNASRAQGTVTVFLEFTRYDYGQTVWTVGEISNLIGATLQNETRTGDASDQLDLTLAFAPGSGAEQIAFDLPVDCTGGENETTSASQVRVVVDLRQLGDPPVEVTVSPR